MTMTHHTQTSAPNTAPATSVSPLEQSGSTKTKFSEYTDVNAASYVIAIADMARREAKKNLRDAKFLIQWKTAHCGDVDNGGEVTAAFKDVFAIRTKANFDTALLEIQIAATEFYERWHRDARCRHTIRLCKGYDLIVTPEQVESTEAAKASKNYSCRQAATELLNKAGIEIPRFDVL